REDVGGGVCGIDGPVTAQCGDVIGSILLPKAKFDLVGLEDGVLESPVQVQLGGMSDGTVDPVASVDVPSAVLFGREAVKNRLSDAGGQLLPHVLVRL